MSAKSRHRRPAAPEADRSPYDVIDETGALLLRTEDPLEAELLAATLLALPEQEGASATMASAFLGAVVEHAGQHPDPASAALLRALVAVAAPHQRRQVVAALGRVTAAGCYPPEQWGAQIGRVTPVEAVRGYDVFGDGELIAVTFAYGDQRHTLVVEVDLCAGPAVRMVGTVAAPDDLVAHVADEEDALRRVEAIDLAQARARLEPALARPPQLPADLTGEQRVTVLTTLPVARARLRRLPTGPAYEPPRYGPDDRAAAVTEFLDSPYAAEAGDEKEARFWAEVLTGYSAAQPGEPPARVGPGKLAHALLSYVPATFSLTDARQAGLEPAVTAWTRWAGERQQLDEAARAELAERLSRTLDAFPRAYDGSRVATLRTYLADVSATTTDGDQLMDTLARRRLAVPLPQERTGTDGHDPDAADAADPAGRRAVISHEFAQCDPPDGMSHDELVAAAVRTGEQLWHDDPPDLWPRARALLMSGVDGHDVVHRLAGEAQPGDPATPWPRSGNG